jgi:hypothetical protein
MKAITRQAGLAKRLLGMAAGATCLTVLAGCSAQTANIVSTDPVVPSSPGVEASSSVASAQSASRVDVKTQPGSVTGYVGALKDVTGLTCTSDAGGVTAAGTVTNPDTTAQDYRIYVSVMEGNDSAGIAEVDVNGVAAGQATAWSGVVAVQTANPDCILRVERNAAA